MNTPNEHTQHFDPCGDVSPDGCPSCPMKVDCYPMIPDLMNPFVVGEPHPSYNIVEAYITFHMESGEVHVIGLEEFLRESGFFDEDDSWE